MVILITGTSHTGKTFLSQKLLEKYQFPYLSLDHLKMGLIRSGETKLSVYEDEKLTPYLWNITKEIIKTTIENNQNLIIEGCYIPFDYKKDFSEEYLKNIKFLCLVMSNKYIEKHITDIIEYENVIEKRLSCDFKAIEVIKDNEMNEQLCKKFNLPYYIIEEGYDINDILKSIKLD